MPTIALITGANKGIGLETARQLGRKGISVLIAARDEARGLAAVESLRKEGIAAKWVALEVTDSASIRRAADQVAAEFGLLDILVNNAGYLDYANEGIGSTVSLDTLRKTFEINYFGMVAVTQAFLPLLRKSKAARIVNLTSILGSIAEHADPNSSIFNAKFLAYDSSKAAVNMFTNHLAHELRGTAIKVNAAHPGWVKTDMGGPQAPLELAEGAKTSVELATLPDTGPSGGFFHLGVHLRW
jgi:NAD(P)-dependent dehydrogenase (short-subunit alcohol dehydrogenase family)